MSGSIYIVTCKSTGLQYIGQAKDKKIKNGKPYNYGPKGRWSDHCSAAKTHTTPISEAIKEYGSDDFTIDVLETATLECLDELEAKWIALKNTLVPNGLNVAKHSRSKHHEITTIQNHFVNKVESVEIRPIKRDGQNRIVYLSLTLKDGKKQRLSFGQGADSSFEKATQEARKFAESLQCPIIDRINTDEIGRKLEQFTDKQIIKARITTASNLIAVYVRTSEMKSYKDEIRICFGGKNIPIEEAYMKALDYVKGLGCAYEDNISKSSQQVAANQVVV